MKLNTAITIAIAASVATAVAAPQIVQAQEAAVAAPAKADIEEGKMVYAQGKRLGAVYRVAADGSAQVLLNGKAYVVPASTLSVEDGKIVTTLSKRDVIKGNY